MIIDQHLAARPSKNLAITTAPELDTEKMKLRKQKEEMKKAGIEREKNTVSFMKTKEMDAFK